MDKVNDVFADIVEVERIFFARIIANFKNNLGQIQTVGTCVQRHVGRTMDGERHIVVQFIMNRNVFEIDRIRIEIALGDVSVVAVDDFEVVGLVDYARKHNIVNVDGNHQLVYVDLDGLVDVRQVVLVVEAA